MHRPCSFGTFHRTYIKTTHKNWTELLLLSLNTSAKFNFVLIWAKLHILSKTLEKCRKISPINQKCIKELINISRQMQGSYSNLKSLTENVKRTIIVGKLDYLSKIKCYVHRYIITDRTLWLFWHVNWTFWWASSLGPVLSNLHLWITN